MSRSRRKRRAMKRTNRNYNAARNSAERARLQRRADLSKRKEIKEATSDITR